MDPEIIVPVALSVVLGGVIGLEREYRGHAAGLRTMILVCLGCTLIMVVGEKIPPLLRGATEQSLLRVDPGRIAQGVVTGIGFLGAGVILKLGDLIRGVTTAATIWFVAAIGICLGYREYALAVGSTIMALVVLFLFQYPERLLKSHIYRAVTLTMESSMAATAVEAAKGLLQKNYGARVLDVRASQDRIEASTRVMLQIRTHQAFQAPQAVAALSEIEGVRMVEWQ